MTYLDEKTDGDLTYAARRGGRAGAAAIMELQDRLDRYTAAIVREMRSRGESWAQVGEAFDMTRQAAHQRWGHGQAELIENRPRLQRWSVNED